MALSPELLKIIACPICKLKVELKKDENMFKCTNPECERTYPINDEIPAMLVKEDRVEK